MEDEIEGTFDDSEAVEEEALTTQRFNVVIVWSPENEDRVSPGDMKVIVEDAISDLDSDATVEVSEIADRTF